MTTTLDCAIYRFPLCSMCSEKGERERRKGKGKEKGKEEMGREGRKGKAKRFSLFENHNLAKVNSVTYSWLCVFYASQSELRRL